MTEFEMMSVLQAQLDLGMTVQTNFFALVSAYLVAGYLAAHRLSLSMALFVTGGFVVFSAFLVIGWDGNFRIVQSLVGEMRAYAEAGKGLMWLPSIKSPPLVNPDVRHAILLAIAIGGVIGSVYFFFQCRRHNLKAGA